MSTESRRIRVLLADDHAVTRKGLQVILERSEEFEVVGLAKDGVEACREMMESLPETRVIMLTASPARPATFRRCRHGQERATPIPRVQPAPL